MILEYSQGDGGMGINARKQNLKKMLEQYSVQDVKSYVKYEKMPLHSFSSAYREKMENMVKQPVQWKKYTFVYRIAMGCICVIVALLIVNQASAYVFGVTLWDKLMEPAPQEMVTTVYQEKEGGRNKKGGGKTAGKERVHDIPTEIPEGYELVSQMVDDGGYIVVKWQSSKNSQLVFTSSGINQDLYMYENREWNTGKTVTIAGYQGKFYIKQKNFIFIGMMRNIEIV